MTEPLPTTDREEHDIDSGRSGDKVAFPDPAAAPLGTDAEASGNPPTPAELAMESAALGETRPNPHRSVLPLSVILCVAVILVFAVAIIAIALMGK